MRSAANTGFASKTQYLSDYLTQLIKGNSQATLDITSLTENIALWTDPELECLSAMSMDSMFELFSNFGRYDSRWNEVFMQPPTKDLQSLMERCKKELKSRKSSKKKTPKKKEPELPWELPRYKFKSRLHTQGPFIEDTVLCAQRGFRNMTGIHLKQGDFTNMPFVDVPVEQQFTRGAFDRYYVWARSFNYAEKDNYFDTTCIDLNSEEWLENSEEMKMKKTKISNKSKQDENNLPEQEGDRKTSQSGEDAAQNKPITNDQDDDGVDIDNKLDYVNIECRWFLLTEAPKINDGFRKLIESHAFTDVMENIKKLSG